MAWPDPKDIALTVRQMYAADEFAVRSGVAGEVLMENAGGGAADLILSRYAPQPAVVLCGPGNNGGDGFVIARRLRRAGWPVRLALMGDRGRLKGDAALMADRWEGEIEPLSADSLGDATLVVDGLFGAGLSRPLEGVPAELAAASRDRTVVAIDVPSGLRGDDGGHDGPVFRADLTATFFTLKPGHLLAPGRFLCGEVAVIGIGTPLAALDEIRPDCFRNTPALWRRALTPPEPAGHKYSRGHALVAGGGVTASGAARMAAEGALRAGSGLVTCAVPPSAAVVYASHLTAVMLKSVADGDAWRGLLADPRMNAALIGPGHGVDERTRDFVRAALEAGKATVLDADALTVFQDDPAALFTAIAGPCIMTPHTGEFARLFPAEQDKLQATRDAARTSGAVVVHKGPDTVIAAPDGRAAINDNAPADLATAGAGDVLAGFALGLLARGMPAFEAACAAVWLHGEVGRIVGPGLIAEDLAPALPAVLKDLHHNI